MTAPVLRVLLVEDEPSDASLARAMLRNGFDARFEVESVGTLTQALRRLDLESFDVLLVDLGLPDSRGMETFVRLHAQAPRSAIVVLTGNDDVAMAARAAEAGAQDYLVKGEVTEALLRRSIRYAQARTRIAGELKSRESRYRRLVDEVRDGIWAVNAAGVTTYVNRRMADLLGMPAESVAGRALVSFVAPERRARVREYLDGVRGGEAATLELEVVRPDGGAFYALLDASPLQPERGGEAGSLVSVRDITAKRHAAEALRESEGRYRALFEGLPDAVLLFDAESGAVVDANPAAEALLGRGAGELAGDSPLPMLSLVGAPDTEAVRARLLGDTPCRAVAGTVTRDGDATPVEVWSAAHVTGGRRFVQIGLRDVAERRRAEHDMRQAQKFEAVARLAGGVGHEFSNLLTAIAGFSEVAAGYVPEGHRALAPLAEVREAARRGGALLRQLLAFARREVPSPRVLSLNALVEDAVKMLRQVIREDVVITASLRAEPATVRADPAELEQVLLNLALNARDAMPAGGRLTFETANEESPGGGSGSVVLTVSDTGCGMDEEVLSLAFDPFFTTKEGAPGSGLGLAAVYGIVKASGGELTVESAPGMGSVFRITLPSCREEVPGEAPPAETHARAAGTVLVVEDDAAVRCLAAEVLRGAGFEVAEARDGEEALAVHAARNGAIDLVLTDVVMPGLSGWDLVVRLRAADPSIRVLFVSGYATAHGGAAAQDGVAVLAKPFLPGELLSAVADALRAPAPPAPVAPETAPAREA